MGMWRGQGPARVRATVDRVNDRIEEYGYLHIYNYGYR